MSRRPVLLLAVLLAGFVVPASPALAGPDTDYQQVVDLTFPLTEGTSVHYPDTYDAPRTSERYHQATDLMVAYGTPIHAVTAGEVTRAGNGGWGWTVTINSADGRSYHYLHLGRDDRPRSEAIVDSVTEGTDVERGQLIGFAGCSGSASCNGGEHLHLEIHDDRVQDPYDYHDHERINPYPSLQAAEERGDYPQSVRPVQDDEPVEQQDEPDEQPRFDDVVATSTHGEDILRLVDAQIAEGCSPRLFCPTDGLTRGQMASLLARALDLPAGEATFSDVPEDGTHAEDIAALADRGITTGCAEDRFCPRATVTREQMASFLARALDLPSGEATFTDVDPDSEHAEDIAALAASGITTGCDEDRFCPSDTLTRAQAATLLVRGILDR